ncbi:MAG: alcohol dehydrogenase catalytic domain-containing protein [Candidatus Latescibacterota bacterium]
MKQVMWMGNNELEYRDDAPLPDRAPGVGEVLLRVRATGLCSTDVHIIQGRVRFRNPPFVLGHEVSGEVVETGARVSRVKPGDRVTMDSVVGCGKCPLCLRGSTQYCPDGYEIGMTVDGGMQEFLFVPERNVIPIPVSISHEESAILDTEVLGALRKPGIARGESLLVLGPGPGGLVAVQIGRILGAGKVILTGTRPERLLLGKRLGADITLDSSQPGLKEAILDETGGHGPDMVFDAAGSAESLSTALDLVVPQGKVVLYGVHGSPVPSVDIDRMILKDLVVYGALSDRLGWEDMIGWIASGKLNLRDIITHRFPLEQAQEAYETVRDRRGGAIKAVFVL